MSLNPEKSKSEFAKIMTAACVRRGYLEKLHAGTTPVTKTGDYSDVKVIDAVGQEIPWNQVSRIDQNEMKLLITGVVNRIHTFLARTIFSATKDTLFNRALGRSAAPWTKTWDERKYLPDFLMPPKEEMKNGDNFLKMMTSSQLGLRKRNSAHILPKAKVHSRHKGDRTLNL